MNSPTAPNRITCPLPLATAWGCSYATGAGSHTPADWRLSLAGLCSAAQWLALTFFSRCGHSVLLTARAALLWLGKPHFGAANKVALCSPRVSQQLDFRASLYTNCAPKEPVEPNSCGRLAAGVCTRPISGSLGTSKQSFRVESCGSCVALHSASRRPVGPSARQPFGSSGSLGSFAFACAFACAFAPAPASVAASFVRACGEARGFHSLAVA